MNFIQAPVIAGLLLVSAWSPTATAEDLVSEVQRGCAAEIEAYCSQVTMGEGRLLACFYAHEDKLSGSCQYTLYDAAAQLEQAVAALNYLAEQCDADIEKFCAAVELGEGRILECIESQGEAVSEPCRQAIADVIE